MPLGLMVLEDAGRVTRVNPAAVVIAGGGPSDPLQWGPGSFLGRTHAQEDLRGCGFATDCPLCPLRRSLASALADEAERGVEVALEVLRDGVPNDVFLRVNVEPFVVGARRHVLLTIEGRDRGQARRRGAPGRRRPLPPAHQEHEGRDLDTRPENWRFLYVSPSVERLRGYSVDEVMAVSAAEAVVPEAMPILESALREHLERFLTGRSGPDEFAATEVEQPCKDGSTVCTEAITSFFVDEESGKIRVLGVTRDISDVSGPNWRSSSASAGCTIPNAPPASGATP